MVAATDWLVGRWKGRTVVCIASGPSLTPEDCELVHRSGLPTIVTNTTFRLCPWADVLFAFDVRWWQFYRAEVDATFRGKRVTCWPNGRAFGALSTDSVPGFRHFGNSGTGAISLALFGGAAKVVMLGYDCQAVGGKTHWHPDHAMGLSNARSMEAWPAKFESLAKYAKGRKCPVENASRETALPVATFPRITLEVALGQVSA